MRSIKYLYLLLLLMPWATLSSAQNAQEEGLEYLLFQELPVVTIAAKVGESVLDSSGTVYVIMAEEIKRYGWMNLREVLMAIPNMDFKWDYNWLQGGQRGFTGAFSGTLLMIDGREVQNILADEAFITSVFASGKIKRIEVLQGPNSTLYGSNAMEGIINIVTKHGDKGEGNLGEYHLVIGEAETFQGEASFRKETDDKQGVVGASVSFATTRQNWDKLADFAADTNLYSRSPVDRIRDRDTSNFELQEEGISFDAYAKFDNAYTGVNYQKRKSFSGLEAVPLFNNGPNLDDRWSFNWWAGYHFEFGENLNARIEYRYTFSDDWFIVPEPTISIDSITSIEQLTTRPSTYEADMDKSRVIVDANYKMGEAHQVIAGVDWWSFNSDTRFSTQTILPRLSSDFISDGSLPQQDKLSIFIQDTWQIIEDKLKATLGVRHNMQDFVEDVTNPRLSVVYHPTENSALKYTYGEGFRAPNQFEVANNATVGQDLKGPSMTMHEVNYSQKILSGDVNIYNSFSVYSMEAEDFITSGSFTDSNGNVSNISVNSGSLQVDGVEDLLTVQAKSMSGFIGFRYADKEDELDIPETKLKVGLVYQVHPMFQAAVFAEHWGEVDTVASTVDWSGTEIYTVDNWTTLNMNLNFGTFQMEDMEMSLSFYVENLLDEEFYHVNNRGTSPVQFLQPPRNFRFKASFKI